MSLLRAEPGPVVNDFLDVVRHRADVTPDAAGVTQLLSGGSRTVTWPELLAAIDHTSARVRGRFPVHQPVIVALDGTIDALVVLIALLGCGVDVLCVEDGSSHLDDARSAIWTAEPSAVITSGKGTAAGPVPSLAYGLIADAGPAPAATQPDESRDPRVLLLTSGSTGEPRVAVHTLGTLLGSAELYRRCHGYGPDDRVLLPLPMAHSFGLVGGVLTALISGAELVTVPRFSLSSVRAALTGGATIMLGSPLIYSLAAEAIPEAVTGSRLRVMLCSGAPLAPATASKMAHLSGRPVRQVYGSTEAGLIACPAEDRLAGPAGVGTFAPGVEWRLADEERLGDAVAGRLMIRSATTFRGYLDGRASALRSDGFFDTGDVVRVSDTGQVSVEGRKDTFVNVDGRKVNPARVERIVLQHPQVADAHVLGLPRGQQEVVCAVVVPAAGAARPDLREEIVRFCRGRLAAHETPHEVIELPVLPRTDMGKIDRTALLSAVDGRLSGSRREEAGSADE
ncbi:acyl--CoA ligase [Amycolatopsis sp. NBC_00345]|uniref:class I adenylate-forming enzyme family protein n=1 Tax=Amycolatopsis sp. NBC_00345 TaxID=2975955 RepID=UPI002E2703B1